MLIFTEVLNETEPRAVVRAYQAVFPPLWGWSYRYHAELMAMMAEFGKRKQHVIDD
jgi:hypothetical protein